MRGLWDQEHPLSPALIRSALTFMGLLLAALAALNVLGGLGYLFTLQVGPALTQFTSGIALPLAIWLGLRLLADLVLIQNQNKDRLEELANQLGRTPAGEGAKTPSATARSSAKAASSARAEDDAGPGDSV